MQDSIYVFGHKNPDTDSVVSAMAYAALMSALGEGDYVAARLGHLNDETAFLLGRFGFEPPLFLHTVRTQVRDLDFDHPPTVGGSVPVSHAWALLHDHPDLSGLPVTDEDGRLAGMITASGIAERDMDSIERPRVEAVPVFNLLSAIEGRVINSDDDVFDLLSGEVVVALPGPGDTPRGVKPGSIVICGQQQDVVDEALRVGAACVILCQSDLSEHYRGLSSPTCLIATPCDAYRAARLIYQSIPVRRIAKTDGLVAFHLDDYIDDVRERMLESRYRSYPVLDETGRVVGTLGRFHLIRPRRKRVVLVDHNETRQSVEGLEQAEIAAIIDHHRLADVQTGAPVFMRNEPVGSTTTIVATMFQEHGLMPSEKLAGLMAAAILSDTVLFKSPTCTARDRRIAERLARIAGVDLDALGREIFAAVMATDRPAAELLTRDFKDFHIAGNDIGIGQINCLDVDSMLERLDEFQGAMKALQKERAYDMVLLMLTDVLRCGTELVFVGDQEIIRQAFGVPDIEGSHVFLPDVLSRKKQIVPALALLWG